MDSTPTIKETFEAKRVFIDGMNAHYPGVDPRLHLFGVDHKCEYILEYNGNRLITKSHWRLIVFVTRCIIALTAAVSFGLGYMSAH